MADNNELSSPSYANWLGGLKSRVQQVQTKAAVSVNRELLSFYWELGCDIIEKQRTATWGTGFLKRLSVDLSSELPDIKGFSYRNIRLIRQWCHFYLEHFPNLATSCCQIKNNTQSVENKQIENSIISDEAITQQAVAQLPESILESITSIPWGHNIAIISKCSSLKEALYYISQTLIRKNIGAILLGKDNASIKKETPGPLNRKRSRKGSRGQRSQNGHICWISQTFCIRNRQLTVGGAYS